MPDNIIILDDHREAVCHEFICLSCHYRAYIVRCLIHPLKDIDCPKCEVVGLLINTGEEVNRLVEKMNKDLS